MAKLNCNDFSKHIANGVLSNLYFLTGEKYFVDKFKSKLCDGILGENKNDFNMFSISSENLDIDKLEVNIDTYPIGSNKKCIVINNLPVDMWNDKALENFENIIKNMPCFTILILAQTEKPSGLKNSNKLKKIRSIAEKLGVYAEFSLSEMNVETELVNIAKQNFQKDLSKSLASKIIKKCSGYDMFALINELQKICEFEHSEKITENALSVVCENHEKENIFYLPKLILSGETQKAVAMLENLINQGETAVSIISVIGGDYIDMFRVKTLRDNNIPTSILTEIFDYKKKEFRIKNAEKNSRNRTLEDIKKCLNLILKADEKLKNSSLPEKLVLTELVVKLSKQSLS